MWKALLARIVLGIIGLVLGFALGIGGLYIAGELGLYELHLASDQVSYGLYWFPITLIGFPLVGAVLGVFIRRYYWIWIVWIAVTLIWGGIYLLMHYW